MRIKTVATTTNENPRKPELLAPAGDFERLQIAIAYGADAVYLGGSSFGLRAKAKNFDTDGLKKAIEYSHQHGVLVYVTANIFARNNDIDEMAGYFKSLAAMGADAFIISDPGVFALAKKEAPEVDVHISTQANTTNYASVRFWQDMGASRVILARELSLKEISEIYGKLNGKQNENPNGNLNGNLSGKQIALEGFIHGAMCMAYSGRCMLSRYMTGQDANLGHCAHPCRYSYRLYAEEVSRPGYFMPVEENEHGTDIFGAEDLCMAAHLPALTDSGLKSFKIEGRMKSAFYVGLATRTYRQAIDAMFEEEGKYKKKIPYYLEMLKMASHRPFTTGFYFRDFRNTGEFENDGYSDSHSSNLSLTPVSLHAPAPYARTHSFVGIVREYIPETRQVVIEQRNTFEAGDVLTFILPNGEDFSQKIETMHSEDGSPITRAPHAQQRVAIKVDKSAPVLTLVAK